MSAELAIINNQSPVVYAPAVALTFQEAFEYAKVLSASGFFADAREAAQAFAKIQAGQEIGIQPMQAMMGIEIIQGKVTYKPSLLAALIKRSNKYDYQVTIYSPTVCDIEFREGGRIVGHSVYTWEDAVKAGVASKDNYKKFPSPMLYARAMSQGVRLYCPDITMQPAYTPEDMVIDGNTGEVLNLPQQAKETPGLSRKAEWSLLIQTEGFKPEAKDLPACSEFVRSLLPGMEFNSVKDLTAEDFQQARFELENRNKERRRWFALMSENGLDLDDKQQRDILSKVLEVRVTSRTELNAIQWRKANEWMNTEGVKLAQQAQANTEQAEENDEDDPFATPETAGERTAAAIAN